MNRLFLIANEFSGKGTGASIPELALRLCEEAGVELIKCLASHPSQLEKISQQAIAQMTPDDCLAVAGGDGTIRTVAQLAQGKHLRFAVIPCGTYNFFCRTHKIPEEPEAALRLALTGQTKIVRLGLMNDQVFLVNASLGSFAKAIAARERVSNRWGRNRLLVAATNIVSVLRELEPLRVKLITPEKEEHVKTPMIFIGNNSLQLRNVEMDLAKYVKSDKLAVLTVKATSRWHIFRLMLSGLMNKLMQEERFDIFSAESLSIESNRLFYEVALDGELFTMKSPLAVKALPSGFTLVVP